MSYGYEAVYVNKSTVLLLCHLHEHVHSGLFLFAQCRRSLLNSSCPFPTWTITLLFEPLPRGIPPSNSYMNDNEGKSQHRGVDGRE